MKDIITTQHTFDEIAEIWSPSVRLRWVEKYNRVDEHMEKVLQQLHTGSLGGRKWIDVPLEEE